MKERIGFVLVIAIAGLGTALIAGNDVIAAVVAIFAGLVFLAATGRRADHEADQVGDATRRKGSPFTYLFAWNLSEMPDLALTVRSLAELGLEADESTKSTSEISFNGGSQVHTRLLGGYFVASRNLPIQARLLTVGTESAEVRLQLEVQDRLKVAVRDEALEKRYVKAAGDIRAAVGEAMKDWSPRPVRHEETHC